MKKFISRILPLVVLVLNSCDIVGVGTTKSIGSAKASFQNDEIFVSNFPSYSMLFHNQPDFGDFSFTELDEFVYKIATTQADTNYLYVTIQPISRDSYGNVSNDSPITIGKIDVSESKKYADFNAWKKNYRHSTERMFWKDEQEYNAQNANRTGNSTGIRATLKYMPKSIR